MSVGLGDRETGSPGMAHGNELLVAGGFGLPTMVAAFPGGYGPRVEVVARAISGPVLLDVLCPFIVTPGTVG
jgi:hypothetical protein